MRCQWFNGIPSHICLRISSSTYSERSDNQKEMLKNATHIFIEMNVVKISKNFIHMMKQTKVFFANIIANITSAYVELNCWRGGTTNWISVILIVNKFHLFKKTNDSGHFLTIFSFFFTWPFIWNSYDGCSNGRKKSNLSFYWLRSIHLFAKCRRLCHRISENLNIKKLVLCTQILLMSAKLHCWRYNDIREMDCEST